MIAGGLSKTVAFVAILAALTFGALATASAQPADIKALDEAFQVGADHAYYAGELNNLALVYQAQGKYTEAQRLFDRAFAILNNQALVYRDQGKYSEAERLLKRALAISEQTLGEGHRHVAGPLNNLANLYRDQGKYWEAVGYYARALAIGEKALGASHPEVAWSLNNMVILYEASVKAGARWPIRGRRPLPSLPIELRNRRVLHRRGRFSAMLPIWPLRHARELSLSLRSLTRPSKSPNGPINPRRRRQSNK